MLGVFQHQLQPDDVAGPVPHQLHPIPGQHPQPTDLRRRHERRRATTRAPAAARSTPRPEHRSCGPVRPSCAPRSTAMCNDPVVVLNVRDAGSLPSNDHHPGRSRAPHCRTARITPRRCGLLRRTVRVEWQLTQDGKHHKSPKTPRSRRTVPLPTVVAETLAAHISEFARAEDGSLSPRPAGTCTGRSTSVPACLSQRPRMRSCPLASPRTT